MNVFLFIGIIYVILCVILCTATSITADDLVAGLGIATILTFLMVMILFILKPNVDLLSISNEIQKSANIEGVSDSDLKKDIETIILIYGEDNIVKSDINIENFELNNSKIKKITIEIRKKVLGKIVSEPVKLSIKVTK